MVQVSRYMDFSALTININLRLPLKKPKKNMSVVKHRVALSEVTVFTVYHIYSIGDGKYVDRKVLLRHAVLKIVFGRKFYLMNT